MRAVVAILLVATVAHAQPSKRSHVEKRLADALNDIKECGKRFTASYDWAAFDAIDFAAASKDKREVYDYESSNMEYLGIGINNMCKDPDYKAMLAKVDAIVYRPSGDKSIRIVAAVDGTTLIFTNNVFGSTRDYHDYESALEHAQVTGTAPPPTTHGVAAPTGSTSSAWDGTYPMKSMGGLGGLCPRNDLVGNLVVKVGKFSFPWIADDWSGATRNSKTVETGRVMGLVHADGTTTTTVAFTHPGLTSQKPSVVKVKRLLDSVTTVPITFTKHGAGGRVVHGRVDVYHDTHLPACELDWEIRDPAEVEAERREAARPRTKAEKAAEAKQELRYKCEDRCRSKAGDCQHDHCTRQKGTCERRCGNDSSCSSNCDSDERSCRSTCSNEEDSCRRDCDRD